MSLHDVGDAMWGWLPRLPEGRGGEERPPTMMSSRSEVFSQKNLGVPEIYNRLASQ